MYPEHLALIRQPGQPSSSVPRASAASGSSSAFRLAADATGASHLSSPPAGPCRGGGFVSAGECARRRTDPHSVRGVCAVRRGGPAFPDWQFITAAVPTKVVVLPHLVTRPVIVMSTGKLARQRLTPDGSSGVQHSLHRPGRSAAQHLPAARRARDRGDPVVRGETGDQTDQESRSAGHGAAASVTAMDMPFTDLPPA